MIQANELRVGNLLNYDTAEGDVVTATIGWQYIQWATEDPKGFNLVHSPIPLTEKWLIKFGFKDDKANGFSKDSIHLEYIEQVGYVFFINGDVKGASITIEYVHQLQNLYFALRGQELTIKN